MSLSVFQSVSRYSGPVIIYTSNVNACFCLSRILIIRTLAFFSWVFLFVVAFRSTACLESIQHNIELLVSQGSFRRPFGVSTLLQSRKTLLGFTRGRAL